MNNFEFDLTDGLKFIKKCFWLIIAVGAAGALTAAILSFYVFKPVYKSSAALYVWDNAIASAKSKNPKAPASYEDLLFINQIINDYIELLESDRVSGPVNLALRQDQRFSGKNPAYSVSAMLKRGTRVISVDVLSDNAAAAAAAADETVRVFIKTVKAITNLDNIQIINGATVAAAPIKPRVAVNTGVGFFIGALLGLALGILLKYLDRSVKTPEDLSALSPLPTIAIIPETMIGDNAVPETMAALLKPPAAPPEEAFRILSANLQFATPEHPLKTLAITSAEASEGKTVLLPGLAAALAENGRKVIVVDANLRHPAVSATTGVAGTGGLSDYLGGNNDYSAYISGGAANIDILPAGTPAANPAAMLMSEKFGRLIEKLAESYDFVLIDAPACLNMVDAAVIGRNADGVLFVVAAGKTGRDSVSRALRQLARINVNVIGFALTRCSRNIKL